MSFFRYPKGSEWRKWDLHVHTPASVLNNQFDGINDDEKWEKYLEKLESLTDISVIGLTDYFSIEGYKKVKEYKDAGNLNNIECLLPNVEIRIIPVTSTDSPINLHIIFSPEIVEDLDSKFFSSLEFNYQNEVYKCIRNDLIKLGRKYRNDNSLQENIAYKIGIEQFKVSFEKVEDIIKKDKALRDNSIIVVSNRSGDGASGIQHSSLAATRENIYRFADCIFSSNPNDRDYFLGKKSDNSDVITRKYGRLKPCIHGSDAHKIIEICYPCIKRSEPGHNCNNQSNCLLRYCWIKADPTFEGLKQIIYEPEERVYIGEESPQKIERNKIIKSITISNSNKWFDSKPILLNDGLVSIIGGKGTGKTAILDLIAYAAGSYKCYEKDENKSKSFLKRAFRDLKGTKIKLEWDDGSSVEEEIKDKLEEFDKEGKVRYLPQDYVEQLCSEVGKNELERQIEDVIFQNIPSELKATYVNFKSYKDAQLKIIHSNKERVTKQIQSINVQIYNYNDLINSKPSKEENIRKAKEEIENLENEIKKISDAIKDSDEQKQILQKIQSLTEQKSNLEKTISEIESKLLKIKEINNKVSNFHEDSKKFLNELKLDFSAVGVTKDQIDEIKIVLYPEDLEQILIARKKLLENDIEEKKEELKVVNTNFEKEKDKLALEKSKQNKIEEINKSLSELKKKRESLISDIQKIETAEHLLPQLLKERENIFIKFFELLFEEKDVLKNIYSPLEKVLKASGEINEKLFDFTVKFDFDLNSMSSDGHELIDLRADGVFRQSRPEALKERLEELKFNLDLEGEKISDSNKESIRRFLKEVEELFTKNDRTLASQLKKRRYIELDFYNWLYSTKYYNISYSIKFNDIELNHLSPGLKGLALIILFLELDQEDKRPILIDQPEENLDNRSVYHTLVRYFRNAKKRRQVIIATHNPNLVVNTDSEQVIVANFDRGLESQESRVSYVSGSLENTFKDDASNLLLEKQGIREHVCEILEGGKDAFEKREQKYGFA